MAGKTKTKALCALAKWLAVRPRGAASRLAREAGLSIPTVLKAKKGLPVSGDTARVISEATGGEVAASDILTVKVGRERFAA
jgi:hypothetical protein